MKHKKIKIFLAVVIAIGIGILQAQSILVTPNSSDNPANPANTASLPSQLPADSAVNAANAVSSELNIDKYTVPAVLTTNNQAVISTEIDGTIKEILVKEGDYFKANDILLKFDCTVYTADLEKNKAEKDINEKKYQSMKKLANLDGASKTELLTSQGEYESSAARLKIAAYKAERCTQKAPFDGQMTELKVRNYETVKVGDKLYTIVDNKNLDVTAIIPSEWLSWLKINSEFEVLIKETNNKYKATVTKIIYNADAVSQSVKLIGKITSESTGLFVGESGNATFKGP
ncbi:MAG: efflux RND transporter periplasmic adaptor subunit [Gammaproteobacteria bacterium]|nr:efflux RND transporter periplasmic adaptor subunit [Gammaproteobacteria bacterium]